MAETRLPDVIDAIVTQAPDAPGMPVGIVVSDGYPIGELPQTDDLLLVGVEDPADPDRADSGDTTQEFALSAGRSRDEAGSVRCCIGTVDGDGVAKTARDRAVSILGALAALARSSAIPFGLQGLRKVGVTDVRLYQNQTEAGAECLLVFSLTYIARI
jgi:hypothetical protein